MTKLLNWLERFLSVLEKREAGIAGGFGMAILSMWLTRSKIAAIMIGLIWFFSVWAMKKSSVEPKKLLGMAFILAIILLVIGKPIVKQIEGSDKKSPRQISEPDPILRNGSFEDELSTAWGTGLLETKLSSLNKKSDEIWWNPYIHNGVMQISAETSGMRVLAKDSPNGNYVLDITNPMGPESHLYGTMSQTIRLKPYATYSLTCWVKSSNWNKNTFFITLDRSEFTPALSMLDANQVDSAKGWRKLQGNFKNGPNVESDFRIISNEFGQVQIDDIRIIEI